jgi:redox-sensitive bicupin YhaK (pirin superfamily)
MKKVIRKHSAPNRHWVGDGFPVHGMFGYNGPEVQERSPFLMMDYAAPTYFEPNPNHRRGVGQHPHRGFETVTIVYEGEVEHLDSTGNGGIIGRGDVQWMTAGAGILHEEFHSTEYSKRGGDFEMVQLWVNLPKSAKGADAGYQGITDADIPAVKTDAGHTVRVIAGAFADAKGPATTFSPMNVLDVRMVPGQLSMPQPEGWTTLVLVLDGSATVNGETIDAKEMLTLSTQGEAVDIQTTVNAKLLLLSGEPIDEPVVGYGPFVMNSQAEIAEAIRDFNAGKFGRMPH